MRANADVENMQIKIVIFRTVFVVVLEVKVKVEEKSFGKLKFLISPLPVIPSPFVFGQFDRPLANKRKQKV